MGPAGADSGAVEGPGTGPRPVPRANTAVPQVAGLRRPRLLGVLTAVATDRIGLVVAPPGTGKTTLLAQWAADSTLPVAWCRLEAGIAGAGRLVTLLWQALAPHVPPGPPPPQTPEELAVALEALPGPTVLVLDDVHEVAGMQAETELEQLLMLAPPQLRVLIGSRRMPGFNLARSELAPLVLLTGDDLRFRTWEVETLFRRVHSAPLPPHDAAALTRYTQGWAAALQLFHLSTLGSHPADRRRAVEALAGRSRYAQDYLTGQVLDGLPPQTTSFLVRTCVFDALTADRCNALLGTDDAQRVLRDLVSRQTLTTTTDGGETFTYHEVLRRHLETVLRDEFGPAATAEWYARAATILEDEGDIVEALRARARAEDWPGVQALLHEFGPRLFESHHPPRSRDERWTALLPDWLTASDPWCTLAEARRMLGDGRLDDAEAAAVRALAQFTDAGARRLCDHVRGAVAAWRGAPVPPRPRWPDLLRLAARRHPLEVARLAASADDPGARAVEGFAHLLAGDHRAARRQLQVVADAPPGTDLGLALAARLVLATLAAIGAGRSGVPRADRTGPVDSARSSPFDEVYLEAERHGLTWLARFTSAIAVAVQDEGRQPGADHLGDLDARGDRWAAALAALTWCIARLPTGTVDARTLDRLRTRLRELDAGVLEVWAGAVGALLASAQQLPEAAEQAREVELQARSAGVPGATAIAYAALAAADRTNREELLDLARSTASSAGLDCRPWAWLPDMSPWGEEPAEPPGDTPQLTPRPAPVSAVRRPVTASDHTPVVGLRCFGTFELLLDGRPAELGGIRPRARAMLRFLAVHAGQHVHRELIADALWGELDAAAALHNLQVSVSSLRGALEPGVPGRHSRLVVRDGESYMLVLAPGSRCDVVEFDTALATAANAAGRGNLGGQRAALDTAVSRYRGHLLPEEGPVEWLAPTRERYRTRAAEAAAQLAELSLVVDDTATAVRAARRGVEIDEYRDDAWQALIAALRASGEPAAAEWATRSYSRVLQELGVSPQLSLDRGTPPPRTTPVPGVPSRTPTGSSSAPP